MAEKPTFTWKERTTCWGQKYLEGRYTSWDNDYVLGGTYLAQVVNDHSGHPMATLDTPDHVHYMTKLHQKGERYLTLDAAKDWCNTNLHLHLANYRPAPLELFQAVSVEVPNA